MKWYGPGWLVLLSLIVRVSLASPALLPNEWSILWVIDNGASFSAQREVIKDYLPVFSDKLKAKGITKFQMAVTNTDYFAQKGKLISLGGVKVISAESEKGVDQFKAMVDHLADSPTSFWEQGLESAYQAIEREGESFIRSNVPLAVIYVTDENDYSCEDNCFGFEPESHKDWKAFPLERYIAQFKSLRSSMNVDVHVFPVVGLPMGTCNVLSYGERYMGISGMMGKPRAFSVCADDLKNSLDQVTAEMGGVNPPAGEPKWTMNPVQLSTVAGVPYTASLGKYVLGGPVLNFKKVKGPAWASVGGNGILQGVPQLSDIGVNRFLVSVCNQVNQCALAKVRIIVGKSQQPPIWTKDPIDVGDIKADSAFIFELRKYAIDGDGDSLEFRALDIPSWLSVSPDGFLKGTPTQADVGPFSIEVVVSDGPFLTSTRVQGRIIK